MAQNIAEQTPALSQGQTFAKAMSPYHGGKRSSRRRRSMKRRSMKRRSMKRTARRSMNSRRRGARRAMHGGGFASAASYPNQFSELLPMDMQGAAGVGKLESAFAQLPEFAGKYGMNGGSRRRHRSRRQHGGVAPVDASAMILSPQEEPMAFMNPQWYTENKVVPTFVGPDNSYMQKAGKRNRRNKRSARKSRKHRA